ncbi:MAG: trigger factor [Bacteroidetes bacterium]|nr:trigger factor [Bacteroidota bacterium]
MNIVKENVDELNAVLKVKVTPDDYRSKVDTAIKEATKKAAMPGFRPGKVPTGLVKKMYGKSILVDEINKVLNDNIHKYISENKLEILGNPMPKLESDKSIDWDNQQEFEFLFDLGLAPQIKVELSGKDKVPYYTIKVDATQVDKYVDDISKRYGKIMPQEVSEASDMLFGDLVELDANNEILPGGIFRSSSLFLERYNNNEASKPLIGLKKDDKVVVDVVKLTENIADRAAMLGVDKEVAEKITSKFQFTVKNISRLQPSELTEELFEKVYGKDQVKTVDEFRERIKDELVRLYANESERKFYTDAVEAVKNKVTVKLPDEFLKRWLVAANDKPITYEQVSAEYDRYADSLKWQLIENKIIKDNEIKVSADEATEHIRKLIREQYKRYNMKDIEESELENSVKRILANEEESKRIFEQLYGNKVMELFKTKFSLDKKDISFDDFSKL